MAEKIIKISYSPNYASGFINVSVDFVHLVALLCQGYRFYHSFDENAIRSSVTALNYGGRSTCYDWLRKLKWANQFTSDLITRKVFRPFIWFQYVVVDVLQSPYPSLKAMLADINPTPNIVSISNNKAYRLFYILDKPQPLNNYKDIYYSIVDRLDGTGWSFTDLSTPKVIKGDKAVLNSLESIQCECVTPLF